MRIQRVRPTCDERLSRRCVPQGTTYQDTRKEGKGMENRSLLLEDVEELYPPEHPVDLPRIERAVREILDAIDRKSTRLNSSHANISYAVFCLKKKKKKKSKPTAIDSRIQI